MTNKTDMKRCQRCGGNVFLEHDSYGTYLSCIQCGAVYSTRHWRAPTAKETRHGALVGAGPATSRS